MTAGAAPMMPYLNMPADFFWRFIQHNARESTVEDIITNLTCLTKRDIRLLADIRFLLSDDVKLLNDTAQNREHFQSIITEKITERSRIQEGLAKTC